MLYLSLETRGGGEDALTASTDVAFLGYAIMPLNFFGGRVKKGLYETSTPKKKCSKLTEDFKFPPSHSDDETGCSRERRVQNFVGSQVSRGITASCRRPALSRLFETMARIGNNGSSAAQGSHPPQRAPNQALGCVLECYN